MKKILLLIFCLALLFPSYAFADKGFSEPPSVPYVYDEQRDAYILKQPEQGDRAFASFVGSTFVSYHLENISDVDEENVVLVKKVKYGSETRYSYVEPVLNIQEDSVGTTVTIYNLDFSSTDCYYVGFQLDEVLLIDKITPDKAEKLIPLASDETYVPIEVNIPFASSDLTIDNVVLTFLDENGNPIIGLSTLPEAKVPTNYIYNVQVNAYDDSNGYCLFKKDVQLSQENNIISFRQEDTSEITIVLVNNSQQKLRMSGIAGLYWNGFNINYSAYIPENIQSIIISKLKYSQLMVYYKTPEGWNFEYGIDLFDGTSDKTIHLDTNFRAKIDWNVFSFEPGQTVFFDSQVYDGNGARLWQIYGPLGKINGTIELKNVSNPMEDYSFTSNSFNLTKVTLPNTTGTFYLTFKVEDSPIPIEPYTTTIVIGDGINPTPDTTPPHVTSVKVHFSNSIEVEFNEPVSDHSVNLDHFKVEKASDGTEIPISNITLRSDQKAVNLTLADELELGVDYKLTVNGVEDLNNNAMQEPYVSLIRYSSFNPDQNGDGKVDIFDIVLVAKNNPEKLQEMKEHYQQAVEQFWSKQTQAQQN